MTLQLTFEQRINDTVVTTINFQSDGRVLDYIPTPSGKETTTETINALIQKTTSAALQTKIQSIETLLEFARLHPTGPQGVWVLYSPDATTSYQSRIIDGVLSLDRRYEFLWANGKKVVNIDIERQNFWEQEAATTLELSNDTVTDATSAAIQNAQNTTEELYVWIAADQVTGVLPTPAILEFENTQNDATLLDDLLVGVFQGDGKSTPPSPLTLVNEGSGTVDASCSGGEYAELSWSDTAENQLKTWTIDSGDYLQRRYRAVARLQASVAYTDLYLKCKLLSGTTVIAETRWALVDDGVELVEIGTTQIPPYALGQAIDVGNITLALYEKRAAGAGSLNLDYMLLMPQDSWRKYGAIGGLAYGETLIDDPVRGILVTDDGAGGYKITNKIEGGGPLMLRPGVKNYLYFLQQDTDGDAPITRSASVVVKIHPRRLTV